MMFFVFLEGENTTIIFSLKKNPRGIYSGVYKHYKVPMKSLFFPIHIFFILSFFPKFSGPLSTNWYSIYLVLILKGSRFIIPFPYFSC